MLGNASDRRPRDERHAGEGPGIDRVFRITRDHPSDPDNAARGHARMRSCKMYGYTWIVYIIVLLLLLVLMLSA